MKYQRFTSSDCKNGLDNLSLWRSLNSLALNNISCINLSSITDQEEEVYSLKIFWLYIEAHWDLKYTQSRVIIDENFSKYFINILSEMYMSRATRNCDTLKSTRSWKTFQCCFQLIRNWTRKSIKILANTSKIRQITTNFMIHWNLTCFQS